MSDRKRMDLDDFFPDDDSSRQEGDLEADNFKTSLSESTKHLSVEELAPPEADDLRQTVALSPEVSAKRETIAASAELLDEIAREAHQADVQALPVDDTEERPTMLARSEDSTQKHGSREGFDERLAQVIARKEGGEKVIPQPQLAPPPKPKAKPKRKPLLTTGCLTILLLFGMVSGVLVIVALFLPPISDYNPLARSLFGKELIVELNSEDRRQEQDGLAVEVLPSDPGENFGVAIQSASAADYLAGKVPAENWHCQAAETLPTSLELNSPVYSLETSGTPPKRVGLNLQLPAIEVGEADLHGWYGEGWHFIPSQAAANAEMLVTDLPRLPSCLVAGRIKAKPPLLATTLDVDETLPSATADVIQRLYIEGMQPTVQGTLQGVLPANVAVNEGYSLLPLLANYRDYSAIDVNTVQLILGNPTLRANHAQNIATFATTGSYTGIAIDYREVPPTLRNQFSDFVAQLAERLHDQQQILVVVVPPPQMTEGGWSGGAYDWRTLGLLADEIIVRPPVNLFASPGELDAMLRWGVGEVARDRLFLGVSALSLDRVPDLPLALVPQAAAWEGIQGVRFETASQTQVRAMLDSPYQVNIGFDSQWQTPFVQYSQNGQVLRTVWLGTPSGLATQMTFAKSLDMAGVVLFDAQAIPQAAEALSAYQSDTPLEGQPLLLHWRIMDAGGNILSEETVSPDTPILYEPQGDETGLRFEVSLEGAVQAELGAGEFTFGMSTAALVEPSPSPITSIATPEVVASAPTEVAAVASPTLVPATATPLPTFTPTIPPTPTLTPTLAPTINAPEIQGTLPPEFEIGTHVGFEYTDEKFDKMRVAGMTWVKVQIRFTPGLNPDDYGWQVQFLHERGFKILWGVVGEKDKVLTPGYFEDYAEFVARLAEIGSDAIEIWNEPNLDREWPTGKVSGASYTELLRAAYLAIRAKNPNTMVISAATAPTGFFGGCQAGGCDDNVFYQQMAGAGADQFMDCIGAHYNEGIVSPLATSGDPRDPYPTRYLMPNTDRAWQPFGGKLPVCYTELGYLTPEGFSGGLPPGFEWAGNVTVAQQASWLATAALELAQSGKVRLMIIWNLDYKDFNPDPHGGFAIIRPDGGCPACDSLGTIKAVGGQ